MKDAPGRGTEEGLAAGIYWGVVLMLTVLGAMVGGVVYLIVRSSRTVAVPPPPPQPATTP